VEGVDVRDNARDYGLTKDAAIVTLTFRPDLRLSFQVGGSLELNDATIFGKEEEGALQAYLDQNPGQRNKFRVPDGTTVAVAQRVGATWDRRDSPLDATAGTFVSVGAEHVNASPVGEARSEAEGTSPFAATDSNFMRYTNRIAGYVRLSKRGLALATSFRWGFIQQLTAESRTYPDRLFFMGGGDSIRGFAQDSLVPEDIARLLLADDAINIEQVLIRGGDVFINPRAELRVPLTSNVQTALFLDTGNLWAATSEVGSNLRLRYAIGSGIRVGTPIGPLVFDYGFNVDRVLDGLIPNRVSPRRWESLGAFHFSIGLF
jgi:outer membrane protein assembly factor BamA